MRSAPPLKFILALALVAGCGGSNSAPSLSAYDADAQAQAAVKQLDRNGNGTLEDAELDACPGLKGALSEIDANGDKRLAADELRTRFARYSNPAGGGGLVSVSCAVTLDDHALDGATVRFEPEPFMGAAAKPAEGKTSDQGRVVLRAEGSEDYGVYPGVYRITVTHPGGKAIPARYNAKTTFGREVFDGARGSSGDVLLRLKSG